MSSRSTESRRRCNGAGRKTLAAATGLLGRVRRLVRFFVPKLPWLERSSACSSAPRGPGARSPSRRLSRRPSWACTAFLGSSSTSFARLSTSPPFRGPSTAPSCARSYLVTDDHPPEERSVAPAKGPCELSAEEVPRFDEDDVVAVPCCSEHDVLPIRRQVDVPFLRREADDGKAVAHAATLAGEENAGRAVARARS